MTFVFLSSKGSPNSCLIFYSKFDDKVLYNLKTLVETPDYLSQVRTVIFKGQTRNGLVVLERQDNLPWGSRFNHFKTGFTRDGDPRNPVLILGPKLAQKMGFSVEMQDGLTKRLFIPGSKNLIKTIKKINRELKKQGLEEISYLPVGFGLATSEQILHLSISGGEHFQMFFPYADKDTNLTVHEASAHLSSLILPRHVLHRAKVVTERNLEMIAIIRDDHFLTAEAKELLIDQIMKDRSIELDFGTGNIATLLGDFRRQFPGKPFESFSETTNMTDENFGFPVWVSTLTQVGMTPAMSVILRLGHILNLSHENIPILQSHTIKAIKVIKTNEGHGNQMKLSLQDLDRIKLIMASFIQKYKNEPELGYKPIAPYSYALGIINNLDRRIEELTQAASSAQ